ncbi:MAG: electron transfer flavoprotein-ubiquinone oxidoreductase [Gammaproteobacteria bacterium RIFCSPHIGHO2_12_FULL_41_20]|nr:MAG: electron transfer flavoprotein-ubiquinone oxidoreductase [Gammaproteobacteria bacterium RIFCSPHIGHO2_12_FULL_41_20]
MSREIMEFDIVIVGAGPSGLSAAIRLAQLNQQHNQSYSIAVLDKGEEVGAHILSGAVLEPRALNELIPDWKEQQAPVVTPVKQDKLLFLTAKKAFTLPTPPQMHNQGNYIISLGKLCRWLAAYAENLGVNIFPGFAVTDALFDGDRVCGVVIGDKGIDKQGQPTSRFQPGMELLAKQVLLAEGCRGSLTQRLFERYDLRNNVDPQTYGLGIKELWEIPPELHQSGLVIHSIGWPLDYKTYGGSFIYYLEDKYLAIGFVVGLDYENPYFNPYEEFQQFKSHPVIRSMLTSGKRIAYGARSLNEGGLQSIPKLTFPGGVIIGCAAGFLNVPKIKGIHNAMKSGMVAAESMFSMLTHHTETVECTSYPKNLRTSWVWEDLYRARNIRPAMRWGLWPGLVYAGLDTYLFRGRAPWTLHNHADYAVLKKADQCQSIAYPKHDNQETFDLLSSVYLTNSRHEENQPCHLQLKDPAIAITVNWQEYQSPEQRYCPAGVYEIIQDDKQPRLQINAANCIQCKACDIKDPTQNIVWTPPEGGSGPQYNMM